MAKLVSTKAELDVLRGMCHKDREVSGTVLSGVDEDYFYTPEGKELFDYLRTYITENGVGFEKENVVNGQVSDEQRIQYLKSAFASLGRAIKDGFDVRGYFLWSLTDNFEWNAGYSMKFGLYTRERQKKASADFYRDWISAHRDGKC